MIKRLTAGLLALALIPTVAACGSEPSNPAPIDRGAGEPDPKATPSKPTTRIRFNVETSIEVVVTYNSGFGNKFIDSVQPPHDDWSETAVVGATAYLSATPAKRGSKGRISVTIDYGTKDRVICFGTNFDQLTAGTQCRGKIH
jgi:hypothetical protein